MEINKSNATFSNIVSIGEKITKLSKETGKEYLYLNRGVNAVSNIDLSEVVKSIDFNSNNIQVYPPNKGTIALRQAINKEYFDNQSNIDNISITAGGMPALDLVVQTLRINTLWYSQYFWGSYAKLATIRDIHSDSYTNLEDLVDCTKPSNKNESFEHVAVLICDPSNPVGGKMCDIKLLENIKRLNEAGLIVIFDSPYRKLFSLHKDILFQELLKLDNVIITESFSKSFGLSGQRIGFIHSTNKEFNEELNVRILYGLNGVNAFAQELVTKLITTSEGIKAVLEFKKRTVEDIEKNIQYLKDKNLLDDTLYSDSNFPVGIFSVVNKSEEELLKHRIGSVSMQYFTHNKNQKSKDTARICVSVPHVKFKKFFDKIQ